MGQDMQNVTLRGRFCIFVQNCGFVGYLVVMLTFVAAACLSTLSSTADSSFMSFPSWLYRTLSAVPAQLFLPYIMN